MGLPSACWEHGSTPGSICRSHFTEFFSSLLEDRAAIYTWLGDSHVWMRIAVERARSSDRGFRGANHNELNVAH